MPRILVATRAGLHAFDEHGRAGEVQHRDLSVTSLARSGDDLWAVIDGSAAWHRSGDAWHPVAELARVRATCIAIVDEDVVVGSSEARLFRVGDGGIEPVAAFDSIDGRSDWYTPWGGPPDTRSIANWDHDVYVNVHVGGIVRSDDRGQTWAPTIDIDADVHQVTTAEGLVLAACAGGLAASTDRGATWTWRTDGLEARYSRAVAVCGDALLVSSSTGPRGGKAAVYRGDLTAGAFERCLAGPAWFDDNIDTHCLDALPDGAFAAFGTSDGHLYASTDAGSTWAELTSGLPPVQRVLVMP